MDADRKNEVDERRAAILLGVTIVELRRLSRVSRLGHLEKKENEERMFFTYEELRRLCLLAAPSFD